jgi:hypothetical protein
MIRRYKGTKAEQFRARGSNILNDKPSGISDFLNDLSLERENTQIHKPTITQLHPKSLSEEEPKTDQTPAMKKGSLGRLHLQIRQDLIDKLINTVFERKRSSKYIGRNATQRSIIEEALEHYFNRYGDQIESDKPKKENMKSKQEE